MFLTQRENDVLSLIAVFGITYLPVLEKTYFKNTSVQYARNRVIGNLVHKQNLIDVSPTKFRSPRSYLKLSKEGKEYAKSFLGYGTFGKPTFSISTFEWDVMIQTVYFKLKENGLEVSFDGKFLIFELEQKNVLLMVELHVEKKEKYIKQFKKYDDIDVMIFAVRDRLAATNLLRVVPTSNIDLKIILLDEITDVALVFYTMEQLKETSS